MSDRPTDPWGNEIEPTRWPETVSPTAPPADWWGDGRPDEPPMPTGPPGSPYLGPPKRDGQAVGALVLALLSFPCSGVIGVFFGAAGVILGVLSRRRIKADDHLYGEGLALAAIVLGAVGFVFALAFFAYTVFINPDFIADLTEQLTPTTTSVP